MRTNISKREKEWNATAGHDYMALTLPLISETRIALRVGIRSIDDVSTLTRYLCRPGGGVLAVIPVDRADFPRHKFFTFRTSAKFEVSEYEETFLSEMRYRFSMMLSAVLSPLYRFRAGFLAYFRAPRQYAGRTRG